MREDINLFDTTNHKQNPQVMVNMSTAYVVKDVMEVLINKKIARTTLIHHGCVVLAYLHVITVLHGDYNVEGIFKVKFFIDNFTKNEIDMFSVLFTTRPSPQSISPTACSLH